MRTFCGYPYIKFKVPITTRTIFIYLQDKSNNCKTNFFRTAGQSNMILYQLFSNIWQVLICNYNKRFCKGKKYWLFHPWKCVLGISLVLDNLLLLANSNKLVSNSRISRIILSMEGISLAATVILDILLLANCNKLLSNSKISKRILATL